MAKAFNFIKKETLKQVFSCEFCEISKKTLFTEHLWTTASDSLTIEKIFTKHLENTCGGVNLIMFQMLFVTQTFSA